MRFDTVLKNTQKPEILAHYPLEPQLSGWTDKSVYVATFNEASSVGTLDIVIREQHEGTWVAIPARHSRTVGRTH